MSDAKWNEARDANSKWYTPGLKPDQVMNYYNNHSKGYDEFMNPCTYKGPRIVGEEVCRLVTPEKRDGLKVLDVAAGTGLVGQELVRLGFRSTLDALEPSEGMVEVLKSKGIYNTVYQEFLGQGRSSIPDASYDVVVMVGGMGENHLPVSAIDDIIRFTKPGGVVVLMTRHCFLNTVGEYKNKFEPHLAHLQDTGKWTNIKRQVTSNYFLDNEGILLSYRVL